MTFRPFITATAALLVVLALPGCGEDSAATPVSSTSPRKKTGPDPSLAKPVDLGSATIGSFTVHASRGQREVKPGGDAPILLKVDGDDVKAVRCWIGTQNGDTPNKARAEVDPENSEKWLATVEVPARLLADSKLWVEVESSGWQVGSFDLKR